MNPMIATAAVSAAGACIVFSPQEIYLYWCKNHQLQPQKKLLELFRSFNKPKRRHNSQQQEEEKKLDLNLRGFGGLSSIENMKAISHVVSKTKVPMKVLDISDNLFTFDSFVFLLELLELPSVHANLENFSMECVSFPIRENYTCILVSMLHR
jgi:hypothetical protein